ncbi:MAG: hypothetical protein MMC33_009132 [Icmadophila ericetorum]|nr:hypothetical protein [Icmadophila ericetorum]
MQDHCTRGSSACLWAQRVHIHSQRFRDQRPWPVGPLIRRIALISDPCGDGNGDFTQDDIVGEIYPENQFKPVYKILNTLTTRTYWLEHFNYDGETDFPDDDGYGYNSLCGLSQKVRRGFKKEQHSGEMDRRMERLKV